MGRHILACSRVSIYVCENGLTSLERWSAQASNYISGDPFMRRVVLIYNPASGQLFRRRAVEIDRVLAILRAAGVEAEAQQTEGPGSAAVQALEAVSQGYDAVLACGGDGTINEVLQSLVGTSVSLGVIPLGTANALAADLGLHTSPVEAARRLLSATPVRVPVGRVFYQDAEGQTGSRYFTVAAGMGADGQFFSRLDARLKRRFGYLMYLVEALYLWATHSFPLFQASIETSETPMLRVEQASQLLAVRISNFGGVVRNLVPGAALTNEKLCVLAFKTRSRLRYLRFIAAVLCGRHTYSRTIEFFNATSVECAMLDGSEAQVFVEADGELLGTLPARIEMAPDAVTLLIPQGRQ